jgi:hypothetical protein
MPTKAQELQAALEHLVSAHSQDATKGRPVKDWFRKHYGAAARASWVSMAKQAYNRPDEQLREDPEYVVFVINGDFADTIAKGILKHARANLRHAWVLQRRATKFEGLRHFGDPKDHIARFFQKTFGRMPSEALPNAPPHKQRTKSTGIGRNIIFFGPPGTGKSYAANEMAGGSPEPFRVLFHPEYTYSDFLGVYRPVVGSDPAAAKIESVTGTEQPRPVCYFDFVPGPLLRALQQAFTDASAHIYLIVDEINRGDCAAIFGDILQLLDRRPDGSSLYGITVRPEAQAFLDKECPGWLDAGAKKLRLPSNFTILATMNTSDQSLYPMDSAFKRRWEWRSCNIDFAPVIEFLGGKRPKLHDGKRSWDWIKLVTNLNSQIAVVRLEDRQLGQWFISELADGSVDVEAFRNKVLYFLWHDVFKDDRLGPSSPFKEEPPIHTFLELQSRFNDGGLANIFKESILAGAEHAGR